MSAQITTPADQDTGLSVRISEKGLSEYNGNKRIVFIPKEQVQLIEIKFGSHAERPVIQLILGLCLGALGLAGLDLAINGGVRGLYWGLGFMGFGAIGVLCLYEAIKRGYYLCVTCSKDTRKLVFKGITQREDLSGFIKNASDLGYNYRDSLASKDLI
jgi:hypothetical protein